MGLPTEHWDHLTTFLVTERLDSITRRQWELVVADQETASFENLKQFLEKRCRALESAVVEKGQNTIVKTPVAHFKKHQSTAVAYHMTSRACIKCRANHPLFICDKFLQLSINDRIETVKNSSLCLNCLKAGHGCRDCKSSTCKKCKGRHNTLLHREPKTVAPVDTAGPPAVITHLAWEGNSTEQVLLATAEVRVTDQAGNGVRLRALLDSGSQATFITESCVRKLQLQRSKSTMVITGLGMSGVGPCKGIVDIQLGSLCSSFGCLIRAFILNQVTEFMPTQPISAESLVSTIDAHNLTLADPNYHTPGRIDILIGADAYYDLLLAGKFKDKSSNLILQNTVLGWIVAGPIISTSDRTRVSSHLVVHDLSYQMQQFWEVEELSYRRPDTPEDIECQEHFANTYTRTSSGRFMVKLPFNESMNQLGKTRNIAEQRLLQLERRLAASPTKAHEYKEFMKEYEELDHMTLVKTANSSEIKYHLPHHYVIRQQSTTTKLRVVFDGSALPDTGLSLNNVLKVGPQLQDDLTFILTRFRMHNIAFSADIEKMYRQVLVHPDHRPYQSILWRSSTKQPIQEYQLMTLTYGTTSAPFLAIRCLEELASLEKDRYPLASKVVMQDFYVDDVLSGCDTLETAKETQSQLIKLLSSGGFRLHKWSSNHVELVTTVPNDQRGQDTIVNLNQDPVKTLGLTWDSKHDQFGFQVNCTVESHPTKRTVLSQISKLFDPLGWIAPIIIRAKIMMQQLWMLSLGWDDKLPPNITKEWECYKQDLQVISQIKIPRQMTYDSSVSEYQLHGFSDASESAYGAAIYIRSRMGNTFRVHLVCSKSKVAPLKRLSLPRLELCGAVLLAKLTKNVQDILSIHAQDIYAWTDSTIVLSWISAHPHRWKTFVANRVTELQSLLSPTSWRHVKSNQNPADCLTRGLSASSFETNSLWWHGPQWLTLQPTEWPNQPKLIENIELEAKAISINKGVLSLGVPQISPNLLNRYSSWTMLIRITAYCLRFIKNCKLQKENRVTTFLTTEEITKGETIWIRTAQIDQFQQEIKCCQKTQETEGKSSLKGLAPFIDNQGILRVGGRLQNSAMPYGQKHPIILPHNHVVTKLIVNEYHSKYLHAGQQLLLSIINTKFWIIRAKSTIREVIHKCVKCFRHRVTTSQQLMGSLPQHRVEPARPFIRCGIDYAGPITIKARKGRGQISTSKAYTCLFICFTTRAVHIELASDLSTDTFIAVLRRFVSRRGKPTEIYSDCGSNFKGADRNLKELHQLTTSSSFNNQLSKTLTQDGITWHFNPPAAPNFGGLWEAGVKSIKQHLRRTIGLTILTYEELYTLLTQIEACLNSRPICPMSDQPDDLEVLTPGHFLTGESLVAVPDPKSIHTKLNQLDRWQLIQRLNYQFWKRWKLEYCARLQQRPKWLKIKSNIAIGDLVLLKQENVSPMQWPMARVVSIHPGLDNLVRTVTVKTQNGLFKRPVSKCCVLPMDNQDMQQLV